MGVRREQLDGNRKSSSRKSVAYIKRQTSKLARRLAKKLLDDAPKKVIRGWDT